MASKSKAPAQANAERGEHALTLGSKTYRLRPSYQAIVAMEAETGRSLLDLERQARGGGMTLGTAAIVATELIRAGAEEGDRMTRAASYERIGEMVYEAGLPGILLRLDLVLLDAVSGGRDASGEAKPVVDEDPETTTDDATGD